MNPPLHLAILNDHMDIVDILLEAGYDINTINVVSIIWIKKKYGEYNHLVLV